MCPPAVSTETDVIQTVQTSQSQSEQSGKRSVIPGFGNRLREAFNGAINRDIARRLGVTDTAAKNYLADRVPPAETLLEIARLTNCSIHWLLTGEGSKNVGRSAFDKEFIIERETAPSIDLGGLRDRIREAFDLSNLEVGQKDYGLKTFSGNEPLALNDLFSIVGLTGTSFYWLLTGDGPTRGQTSILVSGEIYKYSQLADSYLKSIAKTSGNGSSSSRSNILNYKFPKEDRSLIYFGEKEQEVIKLLAVEQGHEFDDQVRDLVLEALKARGLITDQVEGVDLIFFGREVPKLKPMRLWGEIAAGAPIDVFEDFETVLVPEEFFVKGRENFALRVRGDSMEDDGIFQGDVIICYESQIANSGDTVVALVDGSKATVKRFYREGKMIRLQPKSSKHEPIIMKADRVTIQGIVTGIYRRTI